MTAPTRQAGGAHTSLLLVGMMGAGKSSVGRALAERLGWRFVDSDREIERRAGLPVPEIFARHGEPHFRELEREALRALPPTGAVVALGGGAIATEANQEIIAAKGILVWLDASIETLVARTSRSTERPLLAGLSEVERGTRLRALLAERRAAYARAKFRIDTDGLSAGQVAARILELSGASAATEGGDE